MKFLDLLFRSSYLRSFSPFVSRLCRKIGGHKGTLLLVNNLTNILFLSKKSKSCTNVSSCTIFLSHETSETRMIGMSKIVETSASNWKEEVLESEDLVVVEFWHPQCPFCKMLEPIYNELSKEYVGELRFAKFNVLKTQKNQELAAEYGIMSTPTLKFFCGGRPIQDIVGALSKDYLRQGIEFAIKKHRDCAKNSTPLRLPYIS